MPASISSSLNLTCTHTTNHSPLLPTPVRTTGSRFQQQGCSTPNRHVLARKTIAGAACRAAREHTHKEGLCQVRKPHMKMACARSCASTRRGLCQVKSQQNVLTFLTSSMWSHMPGGGPASSASSSITFSCLLALQNSKSTHLILIGAARAHHDASCPLNEFQPGKGLKASALIATVVVSQTLMSLTHHWAECHPGPLWEYVPGQV